MIEPRPPSADDYETISFRSPRKLRLSERIREAAEASGESREALLIARLRTSLGIAKASTDRRHG